MEAHVVFLLREDAGDARLEEVRVAVELPAARGRHVDAKQDEALFV
jgi:hypothetical protein